MQDCLCDTGLDPYSFDLNDDDLADGNMWVKNGKQIAALTPDYKDGCDDDETPWNIPASNIMSYYIEQPTFRNSFSNCQMTLMHDILDELSPNLVMECTEEDEYGICPDIIIDSHVTWTTNHTMCRGQKVIITRDGSLTLDDVTVTIGALPDPPSGSCPDLVPSYVHYWDGFVLDNTFKDEGDNDPAELHIINNSVVEYAKTAISIPNSMGVVEIQDHSTIRNCLGLIKAVDYNALSALQPGPVSYPSGSTGCSLEIPEGPSIEISNSSLSTDVISSYVSNDVDQIKLNGVSIILNGTSLVNHTAENYTAINSSRGRVKVVNGSDITDYGRGIHKNMDMLNLCTPRGLYVEDSKIDCSDVSILNFASNLVLKHNVFENVVSTNGIGYSFIGRNKFHSDLAVLECVNPQKSMVIKENLFEEPWIFLEGANTGSNVLCNTWINNSTGTGIEILEGSEVPKSWGDQLTVSGNKNDNDPRPLFTFPGSGNTLTNFYNNNDVTQRFNYYGRILGGPIVVDRECTDDAWPDYAPEVDEYYSYTPEDLGNLDDEYEVADDVLDVYLGELSHLTGSPAESKRQQIGQAQIRLDDIVRRALVSAQASDSNDIDVWLDRIEPKLFDLSKFFSMWYNGNFALLSMRLDLISDDDAEALKEASDYMLGAVNEDVSMFELDATQLEDLSELAEVSYGDYTNILRTFLDAEYGIQIIRPDALVPRAIASQQRIVDAGNVLSNENVYSVIPNPTSDCVRVLPGNNVSNEFKGYVYDSLGNLVNSYSSSHSNAFICFGDSSPGIYLVTVMDLNTGVTEIHKIVLH